MQKKFLIDNCKSRLKCKAGFNFENRHIQDKDRHIQDKDRHIQDRYIKNLTVFFTWALFFFLEVYTTELSYCVVRKLNTNIMKSMTFDLFLRLMNSTLI